jgi:nitroreductase
MNDASSILKTIIQTRRSIKPAAFSERRIDDAVVHEMLENASWAPTHGMTEPWRFFVFTDAARLRVGNTLADIYRKITDAEAVKAGKAEKLISSAVTSSHVIAIAMKRQDSEKIPEIEEVEAVACAVQNLHLTATAFGVGGYWSSGTAICSDLFRDYLGLNEKDRVLGLFYLGYPAKEWPDGQRQPIRDKTQWYTA